jgi:hypothetical protein
MTPTKLARPAIRSAVRRPPACFLPPSVHRCQLPGWVRGKARGIQHERSPKPRPFSLVVTDSAPTRACPATSSVA